MEDEKICNDNNANCFCQKEKNHGGLHECRCGGSWDNNYHPYSFPNISLGFGAFPNTEAEKKIISKLKNKVKKDI